MKQAIREIIKTAIQTKTFPGCVVGIISRNGERSIFPFGRFTYENDAPPMQEGTVFDVASITKSIPTGSLALKAVEQGIVALTDPVLKWIPELNNAYKNAIHLKHLLTHTLDYNLQLSRCKDLSPQKILWTG